MEAAKRRGRHLGWGMAAWITAAPDLCTWMCWLFFFQGYKWWGQELIMVDIDIYIFLCKGWSDAETVEVMISGITQLPKQRGNLWAEKCCLFASICMRGNYEVEEIFFDSSCVQLVTFTCEPKTPRALIIECGVKEEGVRMHICSGYTQVL